MFSFIKKKLGWGSAPDEAQNTTAGSAPEGAQPSGDAAGNRATRAASPDAPAVAAQAAAAPAVAPVVEAPAVVPSPAPSSAPVERRSWLDKLRTGLRKTGSSIAQVFTGTQIDDALYEELEAALLMADAGVAATEFLLEDLKRRVKEAKASDPAQVKGLLVEAITELLQPLEKGLVVGEHTPTVIMVAGVNGAGKTTTIGKLTRHLSDAGQRVLLAAADTFRAAAREQLLVWADRNHVEIVSQEGGDPAAVTYDAVQAGRARGSDVVIADTAGRLATQLHLMEELRKVKRVIGKAMDGAPHEVLLVVDGNTGQNALSQVKAFDEALGLTGLIVTKLDGTAKGGVLAAIALWSRQRHSAVPVYFIGVGEKLEDLQTFQAREFAQALLS
ncbi:MAG: signal recognition particle-docking protein FtsY [Proteobacteria bacterium]|uniref:signal recognition particle-docking protein FtsY n=1 Tax=Aquabacterium sp. TaxID=1872578 RepID=UPI0035C77F52|nr:signal recognition particle-docking protein FtsY [Pseudomonadota bacterium]